MDNMPPIVHSIIALAILFVLGYGIGTLLTRMLSKTHASALEISELEATKLEIAKLELKIKQSELNSEKLQLEIERLKMTHKETE